MVMQQPFEQVVAEHSATVLRVCTFIAGVNDAEDAWSETFISAMRAYPGLPEGANVQAWLVTIAHNRSIDLIRSRERVPAPTDEVPDAQSRIGIPGATDDELWASVAALPLKQRQAVAYHHLAGLPFTEVAGIMGGSAAAARKAASDGIKALRLRIAAESRTEALR